MSAIVAFNDLNLEISEYQDTWSLSNKQVAQGFGVSEEAIRSQKARNEFKEGVHFYLLQNATGNAKQTFWTKKGIITLGFKLTETPQTILFRDWASDYILTGHDRPVTIQSVLADPRAAADILLRLADTKDKGIDTGEIRLFALMRELGILMLNNEPLQKYLNMGYFRRKPQTFTKPNGERGLNLITLITPKGQVKLAKKLIEAIKTKNAPQLVED